MVGRLSGKARMTYRAGSHVECHIALPACLEELLKDAAAVSKESNARASYRSSARHPLLPDAEHELM